MKRKLLFPVIMVALMVVSIIAFAAQSTSNTSKVNTENCHVTICHKGKTITINCSAWGAHMSHGDTVGECN